MRGIHRAKGMAPNGKAPLLPAQPRQVIDLIALPEAQVVVRQAASGGAPATDGWLRGARPLKDGGVETQGTLAELLLTSVEMRRLWSGPTESEDC